MSTPRLWLARALTALIVRLTRLRDQLIRRRQPQVRPVSRGHGDVAVDGVVGPTAATQVQHAHPEQLVHCRVGGIPPGCVGVLVVEAGEDGFQFTWKTIHELLAFPPCPHLTAPVAHAEKHPTDQQRPHAGDAGFQQFIKHVHSSRSAHAQRTGTDPARN